MIYAANSYTQKKNKTQSNITRRTMGVCSGEVTFSPAALASFLLYAEVIERYDLVCTQIAVFDI